MSVGTGLSSQLVLQKIMDNNLSSHFPTTCFQMLSCSCSDEGEPTHDGNTKEDAAHLLKRVFTQLALQKITFSFSISPFASINMWMKEEPPVSELLWDPILPQALAARTQELTLKDCQIQMLQTQSVA